jgi:hypothetical protein
MRNASEDGYQLATLVVVVLTILVVIAYLLIFINPRVALNPLKPPLAATSTLAVAAVSTLPPTWTPTATETSTPTALPTSTSTSTPTLLPTPTNVPPPPSSTPRPPTRAPAHVAPTPIPLSYSFRPVLESCTHSGSAAIQGLVTSGGGPVDGIHVELATGPDPASVAYDQTVRRDGNGNTAYYYGVPAPASGSFPWHVWVTDSPGTPQSDPNFQVSINNLPADDPDSCWLAIVNFVK